MNLPDSVRVGAATYTFKRRKMDALYGQTHHRKAVINLNTKQADTQLRDTVLHEILHVIFNQAGMASILDTWTHEHEEMMTRLLAPWVLSVIRDNPDLLAFLQA
jgi:Zn-dependent peptidase ImmA (M78 family)